MNPFKTVFNWKISASVLCTVFATAAPAAAVQVNFKVTNLAPEGGRTLMSPWVGFHSGDFDLFNVGEPVRPSLKPLAREGRTSELASNFRDRPTAVRGTNPDRNLTPERRRLRPGETGTQTFDIPDEEAEDLYVSYAAPIMNGDDTPTERFVANRDADANRVFDDSGNFMPMDEMITGRKIFATEEGENGNTIAMQPFPEMDEPIALIEITRAEEDTETVPEPSLILGLGAIAAGMGLNRRRTRQQAKAPISKT